MMKFLEVVDKGGIANYVRVDHITRVSPLNSGTIVVAVDGTGVTTDEPAIHVMKRIRRSEISATMIVKVEDET